MVLAGIVAQIIETPDGGGGAWFLWILSLAVLVGLWFLLARTRRRTYDAYWDRKRREEELRANDPDMARPDEDQGPHPG